MDLKQLVLGVIGVGAMGEALTRGILDRGLLQAKQIIIYDVRRDHMETIARHLGVRAAADLPAVAAAADVVLLAVKPQQMDDVLSGLRGHVRRTQVIVSIAAGVTTTRIESDLGPDVPVIRVMPNTPALVGGKACASSARVPRPRNLRSPSSERYWAASVRYLSCRRRKWTRLPACPGRAPLTCVS